MKLIKNYKIKRLIIILIIIISNINNSKAFLGIGDVVIDPTVVAKTVTQIQEIKKQLDQAKKYVAQGKQIIEQKKLSDSASIIAGDAIQQIGQQVMKSIISKQDDSTNVLTNGSQVVANLDQFLKNNSINSIRSTLASFSDSGNIYTNESVKNIIGQMRNSDTNKVILRLPIIAQNEICNSSKLKNIIKDGEPAGWFMPKQAVANVDIDKLCNVDVSKSDEESQKAQATLISLAKSGYAGSKTNIALSDPANTPSGVQNQMQSIINKQSETSVTNAKSLYEGNGGIIGNMICLDEKGNKKNFDASDPNNNYCSKFVTTKENTPAQIAANQDAAALSPYLGVLAQAQNANNAKTNKYSDLLGGILSIANAGSDLVGSIKDTYMDLSESIDSLTNLESGSLSLSDDYNESNQEYENSSGNNSQISGAIERYEYMRKIDIERLNHNVYTYILMQASGIPMAAIPSNTGVIPTNLVNESITKLNSINSKIKANIILLVKKIAKDNYNRQQLEKLKNQNLSDGSISEAIVSAIINTAPSYKDIEKAELLWENIPEYQDNTNSDESNIYNFIIPTSYEVSNPTTKNNLFSIRVRSYKLAKLLNISTILDYTPNIPIEAEYILDSDNIGGYSESAFCNKINHNICN